MSDEVTYTGPQPVNGAEAFDFVVHADSRSIEVRISREAVEDYAAKLGLTAPADADGLLHYAEMFQPAFVELACAKHRLIEGVFITSKDIAD